MKVETLNGFAVDLGGTKTAAARIQAGVIVQREQCATDRDARLDDHLDCIGQLLSKVGYGSGDPLGVAVTGRIDSTGSWFAVNQSTLNAVGGVPLGSGLRTKFSQVSLINDGVAAAFAEARFCDHRNCDAMAYVTVSTGVGGGIVLNGEPLISPNGLAGHIGFISSRHASGRCGSGRVCTVESVASGRAIEDAANVTGFTGLSSREVFARMHAGDVRAEAIIDRSAAAIAVLCADLTAIFGLQCVIIGGSVGLANGYLDRVRRHISQEPSLFQVCLQSARFGHDSGLLGALAWHTLHSVSSGNSKSLS